jgi:hypothetical protein
MNPIPLLLLLFGVLFITPDVHSEDFSGVIYFQRIKGEDTTYYKYYVLDDYVRVEDFNENGDVNGIMLINLKDEDIKILSLRQRVYVNVPPSEKLKLNFNTKFQTTQDTLEVAGRACQKWIVREKKSGEFCEYWVNSEGYSFFNRMLRILNRKELVATIWMHMNFDDKYFPFIGSSYNKDGRLIERVQILEIADEELKEELFTIPADYQLVEKWR